MHSGRDNNRVGRLRRWEGKKERKRCMYGHAIQPVSKNWALITLESTSTFFTLKSTPRVAITLLLNSLCAKRNMRQVLPGKQCPTRVTTGKK